MTEDEMNIWAAEAKFLKAYYHFLLMTYYGPIPIVDENLLEEVTGLVEWPNAILGSIDPKYMKLPKEILITAMKFHQKYFYLTNQNNEIVPYFITLSNMPKNNVRDKNIRLGNERVLRARLEDAFFFWKNDTPRIF